jgi:hypothetical protein
MTIVHAFDQTIFLFKKYCLQIVECKEVGYDYDSETNTCLKVLKSSSGVTWKEARVICQQDGADLISISTKVKWDFVTNYLRCKYLLLELTVHK